jgi:hypothetical protein
VAYLIWLVKPLRCPTAKETEAVVEFGNSGYVALYFLDEIQDLVIVLTIKHQRENNYGPDA